MQSPSLRTKHHPQPKPSIHVRLAQDLRMHLTEKQELCHKLCNWTAFVNNAGSLAHIVSADGILIRLEFRPAVKNCFSHYIERLLTQRLEGKILF